MKFKYRGPGGVEIEAEQYVSNVRPVPSGVRFAVDGMACVITPTGGKIYVFNGDWIIQQTFGDDVRAIVCKDNEFQKMYEPVDSTQTFPRPDKPIAPPLTLETLDEKIYSLGKATIASLEQAIKYIGEFENRVAALERHTGCVPCEVAEDRHFELDKPDAGNLEKENAELTRDVKTLREEYLRTVRTAADFHKEKERLNKDNLRLLKEVERLNEIIRGFTQ